MSKGKWGHQSSCTLPQTSKQVSSRQPDGSLKNIQIFYLFEISELFMLICFFLIQISQMGRSLLISGEVSEFWNLEPLCSLLSCQRGQRGNHCMRGRSRRSTETVENADGILIFDCCSTLASPSVAVPELPASHNFINIRSSAFSCSNFCSPTSWQTQFFGWALQINQL